MFLKNDTMFFTMDFPIILSKLQEHYHLSHKHVAILKLLRDEEYTAENLSSNTTIPLGRIYTYLNELLVNKLIERSPKRPYNYSMPDPEYRILSFMKHHMDRQIANQSEIATLMSNETENVEIISNKEHFTFSHLHLVTESDHVTMLVIHDSYPFLLYPDTYDEFNQLRNFIITQRPTITRADHSYITYKTYKDALFKDKAFTIILEEETFHKHLNMIQEHFGKKYLLNYLQKLLKKLDKPRLNVYLITEYLPMQVDIGNNKVILSIKHTGVTTGILIQGTAPIQFYSTYFTHYFNRAKPLEPEIEKVIKELRNPS